MVDFWLLNELRVLFSNMHAAYPKSNEIILDKIGKWSSWKANSYAMTCYKYIIILYIYIFTEKCDYHYENPLSPKDDMKRNISQYSTYIYNVCMLFCIHNFICKHEKYCIKTNLIKLLWNKYIFSLPPPHEIYLKKTQEKHVTGDACNIYIYKNPSVRFFFLLHKYTYKVHIMNICLWFFGYKVTKWKQFKITRISILSYTYSAGTYN